MQRATPAQARRLADMFGGAGGPVLKISRCANFVTPTDRVIVANGWAAPNGKSGTWPNDGVYDEHQITDAGLRAIEDFLRRSRIKREFKALGYEVASAAQTRVSGGETPLEEREGFEAQCRPDAFQHALRDLAKNNGQWGVVLLQFGNGRVGARAWGEGDQQRDSMVWLAHRLLEEIDDGKHNPLEIIKPEGSA